MTIHEKAYAVIGSGIEGVSFGEYRLYFSGPPDGEVVVADRRIGSTRIAPVKVDLRIGSGQNEIFKIHPFVVIGPHAATGACCSEAPYITLMRVS